MIQIHDHLPEATLHCRGTQGLDGCTISELSADQRIVLFAVPGAFTPTCSDTHVPGFLTLNDEIRARGVDEIVCVSVNDPFVM
ncbi:MAG: redoxin family protein, partial [Halothiobacillus sp.]|nr:redoxin family protein [Halothiobacillus sp.]